MNNVSEKVADSYRTNSKPVANPNNKVTRNRRKLFATIKERTGNDPNAELDYSLAIINRERPKIESYVINKNEVPADKLEDLVKQAYALRCVEIDSTANTLGVSENEANIFLEDDEADTEESNNYEAENFIGELFAPIELAVKHLNSGADNFIDPSIITGITNVAGQKIDSAQLRRAAQNKPSGIIGMLSGGKGEYELLKSYLQKEENKDEKQKVLSGIITNVSQLRGYGNIGGGKGVNIAASDVINEIAKQKRKEEINKILPYVLIGVVAIILITVYISKNAKSN